MRKPIEQKSPLAAWATVARDEAGMSVEEVVAELERRGHSVRAATIRGIEGGSKGASARLRRLLSEIYDKPAPGQAETAAGSDPVAAAIRAQTEVMLEQTQVFRDLRDRLDVLAPALVELLAARVKEATHRDATETRSG